MGYTEVDILSGVLNLELSGHALAIWRGITTSSVESVCFDEVL